jgi:hypothetical protein
VGFQGTPARLFYDFCLDEHVPFDHVLRGVDRHLELDDLRRLLKPFYSQMGRPSVDPELMIRMCPPLAPLRQRAVFTQGGFLDHRSRKERR